MTPSQLVISCSLSPTSHSAQMADYVARALRRLGAEVERVDLRTSALPLCDGDAAFDDETVIELSEKIRRATAVTLAVPVYNFDVGGAARNLIAMTGRAWTDKIVGFVAAAGGERSYMSLMPLANSLMLDFRCVILPRYVYASRRSFQNGRLRDAAIEDRLDQLARDLDRFASALGHPDERALSQVRNALSEQSALTTS